MTALEALASGLRLEGLARVHELGSVQRNDREYPLIGISLGTEDPRAPVVGFFGGVHGVERIGTQVVLAYLHCLRELMRWDEVTRQTLEHVRVVFMPIVNPVGMMLQTRANGNGVDLMRNAPVEAKGVSPFFLPAGQRISSALPWYRGALAQKIEPEAEKMIQFVKGEMFQSRFALPLDVHSGFGTVDRLWFPYARTKEPFPLGAEVYRLKLMLDRAQPNHVYKLEPQSRNYVTHGDIWDHLFDLHGASPDPRGLFLPFTLEMGSWAWVRKNPFQLLSGLGPFNPLKLHRLQRALRRHIPLLDFLVRVARSHEEVTDLGEERRSRYVRMAEKRWYRARSA